MTPMRKWDRARRYFWIYMNINGVVFVCLFAWLIVTGRI